MTMRGWTAGPTDMLSPQTPASGMRRANGGADGFAARLRPLPQVRKRVLPGGEFVAKEDLMIQNVSIILA